MSREVSFSVGEFGEENLTSRENHFMILKSTCRVQTMAYKYRINKGEFTMNMNPAALMKIMSAKNKFTKNHPKFVAFCKAVFSRPLEEGTIIEITVTRPGEEPITANMKILQSDLELLTELKDITQQ